MEYTEKKLRVLNKTKFDIGVTLLSGQQIIIRHNSFQLMTPDDIMYVESLCTKKKPFSQRMLVPVDSDGKELTLDQIGLYPDDSHPVYMDDDEIKAALKQTNKKIEAWLEAIEDPAQLYAIAEVAKSMDLPASKLTIIAKKVPTQDFLAE